MRATAEAIGGTHPSLATALSADVAILREVAARLGNRPLDAVDADDASRLHGALRSVSDQLRALDARLLARIEADGRWAASGAARTFPEWVARRGGASVGTARRETSLGRALEDALPTTRDAVANGRMSLEHAQVLAQHAATSDARRAALASDRTDRNEAHLVDLATRMGVDDYRRTVRRWAAAADEAAHEAEDTAAVAREHLTVSRRPDGIELTGFLAGEHGEVLLTALRTVAGVPSVDDPRSSEQRRAAALTDLARLVLDRGLAGAGRALVRPHISVHVDWATLERVVAEHPADPVMPAVGGSPSRLAELDDGTPIPASVLARIACDSELTRIVFGPDGEPLDVGRTQRTYTGAQRRAVIARDRTCRYPGCGAPPTVGEVHHARWWVRDDGETSVENGVLLCWYHHDLVHRRSIAITRGARAAWTFREPDGTVIGERQSRTIDERDDRVIGEPDGATSSARGDDDQGTGPRLHTALPSLTRSGP